MDYKTIKEGDTLLVEPLDTLPNFERVIVAQGITDEGILYGATEESEGRLYPFWAIKTIKKGDNQK